MEKEKVLSKVQKLLALSGSSNDSEAQSALLMAQRLLAKYNLDMSDVQVEDKEREVVEITATDVSAYNRWVRDLGKVVAENFGCESAIASRGNWMRVVFIGFESNASVAKEVFEYASKFAERTGGNYAQRLNDKGLSAKGVKADYVHGFVTGLQLGWEKQMTEEFALVLQVPVPVKDHMKQYGSKAFNVGHTTRAYDPDAIASGVEAGKAFANMDKPALEGEA